jgi:hypothetical protein
MYGLSCEICFLHLSSLVYVPILQHEAGKLADQQSSALTLSTAPFWERLMDRLARRSLVNHAAHLRGFAFGAAFAALALGLPSFLEGWRRWDDRRRDDSD